MEESPVFELRTDPIMGRKVFISEGRAGRPMDFGGHSKQAEQQLASATAAECPFCAGHESETPPTSAQVCDQSGQWSVRVVPNKYPAVRTADGNLPDLGAVANGATLPAEGFHEVIIESPQHLLEVTELSPAQYATVLRMYRDRVKHWSDTPGVRQVILFKNSGFAAGASLGHLHSQLIALPYGLAAIEAELAGAEQFYQKEGVCVFCDLAQREAKSGTRIVAENERFVAFCAFAGRQPYETWILPKSHEAHFHTVGETDLELLARLLHELVERLANCLSSLTYNLVLHTAPVGDEHARSYHWHWELIPRSTQLAGLEFGGGAHINPFAPERAASFLRKAKC